MCARKKKRFSIQPCASRANARLNLCRRPQNLFCACFGCPGRDRAGMSPCSARQILKSVQPRGDEGHFSAKEPRALCPLLFQTIKPQIPRRTLFRCGLCAGQITPSLRRTLPRRGRNIKLHPRRGRNGNPRKTVHGENTVSTTFPHPSGEYSHRSMCFRASMFSAYRPGETPAGSPTSISTSLIFIRSGRMLLM